MKSDQKMKLRKKTASILLAMAVLLPNIFGMGAGAERANGTDRQIVGGEAMAYGDPFRHMHDSDEELREAIEELPGLRLEIERRRLGESGETDVGPEANGPLGRGIADERELREEIARAAAAKDKSAMRRIDLPDEVRREIEDMMDKSGEDRYIVKYKEANVANALAKVINCSFGSSAGNPALEEAIAGSSALFVCAAGNNRRDLDEAPSYPACYDLPNVIGVASVNADGGFSYYSNYGANVDMAALGRDVWSALPEGSHGPMSGTSMAAGQVTAAAAMVGAGETLTAGELKRRLVATGDRLSNLQNKVREGRRLNLANALGNIEQTGVTQNYPADDFDAHGYQPTENELWELYSSNDVVQISASRYHSVALKSDGTVWAWGDNTYGQLGDGTKIDRSAPVQVAGLSGVVSITAAMYHSVALKNDGTVWAWGRNNYGQLGDGTTTHRSIPVQVSGLTGVVSIASRYSHNLAAKSDGTVWAWGHNGYGPLGDGTTTHRSTPFQVNGVSGVVSVAAGNSHSVALKNDGTVWAWGLNCYGQVGDGTNTDRHTPVKVSGLTGVVSIATEYYHNFAIKSDGTAWSWGLNNYGQLGDGTTTHRSIPVQVSVITGFVSLAPGGSHSLALKSDGTVWAWGNNYYGQLGDGTKTNRTTPVQVSGMAGAISLSASSYHSLAAKNGGTAWACGGNAYGQLGDGTKTDRTTPVRVLGLGDPNTPGPVQSITKSITANGEFIVICTLENISTFAGATFKATYNPAQVTLVDFAAQTTALDIGVGTVPGTDLQILAHNAATGELTFKVNKTIAAGKSWSGAVTALRFRAKANGSATIGFERL